MIGHCKFFENGVQVGEVNNLITTSGKRHILKYMAGYVGAIVNGIGFGVGQTAAALTDKSLEFEFARTPILLSSVDYANSAVVFKGTLNAETVGTIYEVGLWSEYESPENYAPKALLNFGSTEGAWSAGTWQLGSTRIGADSMRLAPTASATLSSTLDGIFLDLSGYSTADDLLLAYYVNSAFVSNIKLRLYTSVGNYYERTVVSTPTVGYKITAFKKSDFVATGAPTWASITSAYVSVTSTAGGTGSVDFDGLRVEDRDYTSEQYTLVSHAISASPIVKSAGLEMDFEYSMVMSI